MNTSKKKFYIGDLNTMSPEEIYDIFFWECNKKTPDLELIKVILDNRLVDINPKNKYNITPLHFAVDKNSKETAKLLISAGADVNAETGWGKTPLDYARTQEMKTLLKTHGTI